MSILFNLFSGYVMTDLYYAQCLIQMTPLNCILVEHINCFIE